MSIPTMEFIPLWCDIIEAPNWKILDLPPDLYRFWTFCLMAAQKYDHVDGYLPDLRTLARWFGMGVTEAGQLRDKLVTTTLIECDTSHSSPEFKIHDWQDWRLIKDPGATKRKRRQRGKLTRLTSNQESMSRHGHGHVTATSQDVTPQHTTHNTQQVTDNNQHSHPPNPPQGERVGEDLEPFQSGKPEASIHNLPTDKQRVFDRQIQRWGHCNGERAIGDLLLDYDAKIVAAACDHHYADSGDQLRPKQLRGICKAMQAGTWRIEPSANGKHKRREEGPTNQPAVIPPEELARYRAAAAADMEALKDNPMLREWRAKRGPKIDL